MRKPAPIVLSPTEAQAALAGKRPMTAAAEASTTGPASGRLEPAVMDLSFSEIYATGAALVARRKAGKETAEKRRHSRARWLEWSREFRAAGVSKRWNRAKLIYARLRQDPNAFDVPRKVGAVYAFLCRHPSED